MQLNLEVQLVLQSWGLRQRIGCKGFKGLPTVSPASLVLLSAGSNQADQHVHDLRRALERELVALTDGVERVSLACETSRGNLGCHVHLQEVGRKVLILVGDDKTPFQADPEIDSWLDQESGCVVLPLFPFVGRSKVSGLLPSALSKINAQFWSYDIGEAIPSIFALAGLTFESPRIFISYRQKESVGLAMQLFDALAHEGFDVFLDHYRIPPGLDFQKRLAQELGDKSMILLLESKSILDSEWTLYEINVAKECGLGIFALQPPGGQDVPGVDEAVRERLGAQDFASGQFSPTAVLTDHVKKRLVARVRQEHDRALVRRRQMLRTSLVDALLLEGVAAQPYDQDGILNVLAPGPRHYRVWLTPRPPTLEDFHLVHLGTKNTALGVVVGLSRLMEPARRRRTAWLANLSRVHMVDEGLLKITAQNMARGTL